MAAEILQQTLKDAALVFTRTDGTYERSNRMAKKTSQQALAFVSGTGLEVMIERYSLDYDAQAIRDHFYRLFHVKP